VTLDALSDAIVKCDSLRALGLNGSVFSASKQNTALPEQALIQMVSKSNCPMQSTMMENVISMGLRFNPTLARLGVSCNTLKNSVGISLADYSSSRSRIRLRAS
jgi:hypothetical protein